MSPSPPSLALPNTSIERLFPFPTISRSGALSLGGRECAGRNGPHLFFSTLPQKREYSSPLPPLINGEFHVPGVLFHIRREPRPRPAIPHLFFPHLQNRTSSSFKDKHSSFFFFSSFGAGRSPDEGAFSLALRYTREGSFSPQVRDHAGPGTILHGLFLLSWTTRGGEGGGFFSNRAPRGSGHFADPCREAGVVSSSISWFFKFRHPPLPFQCFPAGVKTV